MPCADSRFSFKPAHVHAGRLLPVAMLAVVAALAIQLWSNQGTIVGHRSDACNPGLNMANRFSSLLLDLHEFATPHTFNACEVTTIPCRPGKGTCRGHQFENDLALIGRGSA